MTFFGVLTVVFVVLKLTDVIAWSWWLVLLPILPGTIMLIASILLVGYVATHKHN